MINKGFDKNWISGGKLKTFSLDFTASKRRLGFELSLCRNIYTLDSVSYSFILWLGFFGFELFYEVGPDKTDPHYNQ